MTANLLYHERRKDIDNEIEILKQRLKAMDIEQRKNKNNYGFSGNCWHILESINEINNFLKGY